MSTPVLTPDLFWLTATEFIDCICAAIDVEAECKCPCRKYVSAGPAVSDDCCEGQLTAWLDRVFFHEEFPQSQSTAAICTSFLAGEFTIERITCAPTVKDDGSAPTAFELSESARKMYQELYIAIRALSCCLSEAKRHRKYIINEGSVKEPQGGCTGWRIRVTIELHDPRPADAGF